MGQPRPGLSPGPGRHFQLRLLPDRQLLLPCRWVPTGAARSRCRTTFWVLAILREPQIRLTPTDWPNDSTVSWPSWPFLSLSCFLWNLSCFIKTCLILWLLSKRSWILTSAAPFLYPERKKNAVLCLPNLSVYSCTDIPFLIIFKFIC